VAETDAAKMATGRVIFRSSPPRHVTAIANGAAITSPSHGRKEIQGVVEKDDDERHHSQDQGGNRQDQGGNRHGQARNGGQKSLRRAPVPAFSELGPSALSALHGQVDGLRSSERDDHVGRPRDQDPLSGSEAIGDALRAQTSLLDGPISELHCDVVIGHAVEPERLHHHDHGLLLTQHPCQLISRLPGSSTRPSQLGPGDQPRRRFQPAMPAAG
jgi:hypothetical protein